jgi:hypothetical protein
MEKMGELLVPARVLSDLPIAIHKAGLPLRRLHIDCLPTTQDFHMLCPDKQNPQSPGWNDLWAAFQNLEDFSFMPCATPDAGRRHQHIPPDQQALLNQFLSTALSSPNLTEIRGSLLGQGLMDDSDHHTDYYPVGSVLAGADWPPGMSTVKG